MPQRSIPFINNCFYHIFNRGVAKKPTYFGKQDYQRFIDTLSYYGSTNQLIKFSAYRNLSEEKKQSYLASQKNKEKHIEIVSFCLMPNHFHLLLRQKQENGITLFMNRVTNSYTKYINFRNRRVGPLFQGIFKSVFVEDDEQLLHLSMYIHINPVVAHLCSINQLEQYPWSSYVNYISSLPSSFIHADSILEICGGSATYKKIINDPFSYEKNIQHISHLAFDLPKV